MYFGAEYGRHFFSLSVEMIWIQACTNGRTSSKVVFQKHEALRFVCIISILLWTLEPEWRMKQSRSCKSSKASGIRIEPWLIFHKPSDKCKKLGCMCSYQRWAFTISVSKAHSKSRPSAVGNSEIVISRWTTDGVDDRPSNVSQMLPSNSIWWNT